MSRAGTAALTRLVAFLFCAGAITPLRLLATPAQALAASQPEASPVCRLFLKVELSHAIKLAALKPGDTITGTLARPVYCRERELFPMGASVRLTVDSLLSRRRPPNDHWPWVVTAFSPRHEKYPTFHSAVIQLPGETQVPLTVTLLSLEREIQVRSRPAASSSAAGKHSTARSGPTATLEASLPSSAIPQAAGSAPADSAPQSGSLLLPAGTEAKAILLNDVSASRSARGETLQARVVEPVRIGSTIVLPEGTLLQGQIVKTTRPRMLSRAGSLFFSFTRLNLPQGEAAQVTASVGGVELDSRSHTRVDPEGTLHGDRPGKAWMLLNAGAAGGMAKAADDGTQLVIEAIVSTATDASTAGTARIAATCVSGIFLLTRHGRDVVLPRFTEMNVVFDRPLTISLQTHPGTQK